MCHGVDAAACTSLLATLDQILAYLVNLIDRLRARRNELDINQQVHQRVQHIGGSREEEQYVSKTKKVVDELPANLEKYADEMTPEMGVSFRGQSDVQQLAPRP